MTHLLPDYVVLYSRADYDTVVEQLTQLFCDMLHCERGPAQSCFNLYQVDEVYCIETEYTAFLAAVEDPELGVISY